MSRVLIAGASRGIGLELARQYAEQGDEVIACVRDSSAAPKLDELAATADKITVEQMDLGEPASIEAAGQRISGAAGRSDSRSGRVRRHATEPG